MAKRYLDNILLDKDWFLDLNDKGKAELFFLFLKCDAIGVYTISRRNEKNILGREVDWLSLIPKCSDNLEMLDDKRVFITNWCEIQYGDRIRNTESKSPPIISHQKLAMKHGLYNRLCLGYRKVNVKFKEEEEDKFKNKEEEEDKDKEGNPVFKKITQEWQKRAK
jgi:hypothetical protein